MEETIKTRIEELINSDKVFLFMKGTPEQPRCGFSMRVVNILHELNVTFKSFDILTDENVRQSIKEFANWPTFPQLWVNGKLIGGCDIITEMYQSGELKRTLEQ